MPLSLDIIIPTYNRDRLLPPLVNALLPQCLENDHIFIVRQGAEKIDLPQFPSEKVITIQLPRPNLPAARNHGINASKADIVLFLDDDVEPAPDLVEKHRACYDDPDTAGVAGYVDDPLFLRERSQPSFIDLTRGDCVQNFSCTVSQKTASAMGANMSFRRKILEGINGFDEHFTHNALWEEVDCCLRLLASGRQLRYCADAKVKHRRQDAGGCRGDRGAYGYLYHQFANTAYFASRFALRGDWGQWFTFWKYRLEYFSRKPGGRDFGALLAGFLGMAGGIGRFLRASFFGGRRRYRIDRAALSKTLLALGSKG
jgi:GT2 family glycosyltransferase